MRVGLLTAVATAIAIGAIVATGGGGGGSSFTPTFFVAQTAQGSGDGSSCANAKAVTAFNTAANWGVGKSIAPGGGVGLCGTITTTLSLQGSGTVGNPITIYWTAGAVVEQPVLAGISFFGGFSYLTFDGGTNGIMRSAVGGVASNGDGLANANTGTNAFYFAATSGGYCDHCTFKNLTIGPLYIHIAGTASGNDNDAHAFAQVCGTDITITNNTIFDTDRGVQIFNDCGHDDNNIHVDHNVMYNINHGFDVASVTAGASVWFNNNHVYDYSNWDTSDNRYHHDGMQLQPNGKTVWTLYMYDNLFNGTAGTNLTTVGIDGESDSMAVTGNIYAFNNVVIANSRVCCGYMGTSDGHWHSYNNTVVTETNTGGSSTEAMGCWGGDEPTRKCDIRNNVASHAADFVGFSAVFDSGAPDYNLYADCVGGDCFGGSIATFAAYRTANPTWDVHSSYTADAKLSATGVPQAGSAALNAGTDLSSLCTGNLVPLCSDINGVARPSGRAWDAGAYQVSP